MSYTMKGGRRHHKRSAHKKHTRKHRTRKHRGGAYLVRPCKQQWYVPHRTNPGECVLDKKEAIIQYKAQQKAAKTQKNAVQTVPVVATTVGGRRRHKKSHHKKRSRRH